MSKIRKSEKENQNSKRSTNTDEKFAYRTVILSAVLAGFFLVVSLFFNAGIITFFMDQGIFLTIIDIIIKVIAILLFCLFMIISFGNYKELRGEPIKLKSILIIFIISLLQSFRNLIVFGFTLVGLIFLLIYLYFIHEG
ncbi:MAG: hypothetical protein ACFE85_09505 [Candidatus Hodarchaeota archaeon]